MNNAGTRRTQRATTQRVRKWRAGESVRRSKLTALQRAAEDAHDRAIAVAGTHAQKVAAFMRDREAAEVAVEPRLPRDRKPDPSRRQTRAAVRALARIKKIEARA